MADTEKRLLLRLPEELHQDLADAAVADLRSLNAEILVLLREALAARARQERQIEETAANKTAPGLMLAA